MGKRLSALSELVQEVLGSPLCVACGACASTARISWPGKIAWLSWPRAPRKRGAVTVTALAARA